MAALHVVGAHAVDPLAFAPGLRLVARAEIADAFLVAAIGGVEMAAVHQRRAAAACQAVAEHVESVRFDLLQLGLETGGAKASGKIEREVLLAAHRARNVDHLHRKLGDGILVDMGHRFFEHAHLQLLLA